MNKHECDFQPQENVQEKNLKTISSAVSRYVLLISILFFAFIQSVTLKKKLRVLNHLLIISRSINLNIIEADKKKKKISFHSLTVSMQAEPQNIYTASKLVRPVKLFHNKKKKKVKLRLIIFNFNFCFTACLTILK
jgi:hypothetical protein